MATADPATLPAKATWYLATDLPRPGGPREADSPEPAADLHEVVRIYGIRHWMRLQAGQGRTRAGRFPGQPGPAIRRHQTLVTCAFSFGWDAWFSPPLEDSPGTAPPEPPDEPDRPERRTNQTPPTRHGQLAQSNTRRPSLARPLAQPPTMLASLDECTPPPELQALINAVGASHPLDLYSPA